MNSDIDTIRTNCKSGNTAREVSCADCRLNQICLPIALTNSEVDRLDQVIQRGKPRDKGEYLYRMNDEFEALYAVRSGSFKSYMITESGIEQITAFYLPGDIMGVDGVAHNHYHNNVVAMERSTVCRIPFSQLESLSAAIPSLQRNLFRIMSGEITREQQAMTLLGSCTAEQKVASFLLGVSSRMEERGHSSSKLQLSMSRGEIANYLGLTIETVSRLFNRFKKAGTLNIDNKNVVINDMSTLKQSLN